MLTLADIRAQVPSLAGLGDEEVFDTLASRYGVDKFTVMEAVGYQPKTTKGEAIADTALALGTGVVSSAQMLTNIAGADNPASQALGGAVDTMKAKQSLYKRALENARAEKIKAAEQSGSILNEVTANVGAFFEQPLDMTVNALGTSLPTLATMLIPGAGPAAVAARVGAAGAMGAAQGAGSVKGSIYDQVKQAHIAAGMAPEQAAQRAAVAQSYDESPGNIAAGAGLGILAGTTGAEAAVGRLMAGKASGSAVERGLAGRMAVGAAKEAPMEALQGGQERLAGNMAAQAEGFDVPTFQGVAGQAAQEGLASMPVGAGFGAMERHTPRPAPRPVDPVADIAAAPTVDDAIHAAAAAVAAPVVDTPTAVPSAFTPTESLTGSAVDLTGNAANAAFLAAARERLAQQTLTGQMPDALMGGLAPENTALLQAAQGKQEDRRQAGLEDRAMAGMERQAQRDLDAQRDRTQPAASGEQFKPQPMLTGDIVNPRSSLPYKTEAGALNAARAVPGGKIVEVEGGFVIRPTGAAANVSQPTRVPSLASGSDRLGSNQPGAGVGTDVGLRAEPGQAVSATPDSGQASGQPVPPGQPADAVAVAPEVQPVDVSNDGKPDPEQVGRDTTKPRMSNAEWLAQDGSDKMRDRDAAAEELVGQIEEESRTKDFAPKELPQALANWAKQSGVPLEDLREAVLKRVETSGMSKGRKAQVRTRLARPAVAIENSAAQPTQGAQDEKVTRQETPQEVLTAQPAQGEGRAPVSANAQAQREAYAAAEKRRRAAGDRARKRAHESNPMRAFIAKHGIKLDLANEFAPGQAERRRAMVQGYGPIFRRAGLQLDELAQRAVEEGFLTSPDVGKLHDLIGRAIRGERIIPQYAEGVADQEMEARVAAQFEDHLAQQEAAPTDPFIPAEILDDVGYNDADPEIQTEFRALMDLASTQSIDIETIIDDASRENQDATEEADYYRAAIRALQEAIARGAEDGRASTGQDGGTQAEGLTAPTPAEVVAQQDRTAQAGELDRREQIQREAAGQTLTAQTAPERRTDTTADIFGGVTADDARQIDEKRRREKANSPEGPDMFDQADEPATSPNPDSSDTTAERVAAENTTDGQRQQAAPAQTGAGEAKDAPAGKIEAFKSTVRAMYDGTLTLDDYKAAYAKVKDAESVKAELAKMTKDELIQTFGIMARPSEKKDSLIDSAYNSMLRQFAMGKDYGPNSYMMTAGGFENYRKEKSKALDVLVDGQTQDDLKAFADEIAKGETEHAARRAAMKGAIENPKTLQDFRNFIRFHTEDGKTYTQARMMLTPEQRAEFDSLTAEETRSQRKVRKEEQQAVKVAGQKVDGQVIETKHTQKGHDLFVVQLAERVSREDYETLNAGAKKMGGYYSSYRGGGAVPGFQFTARDQAEAFVKLAGGDNTAAREAAQERRDAYADDRSQTASERLTEMADAIEAAADESLGRERKANTARRARFAAAAESAAREAKAMAKTMRNVAQALTTGKAKFLDRIRTKTQVELLQTYVANAKGVELRAKYPTYAEQEKRKGQPPTQETADYAEFPQYTAYRSDLASLGRQLLEVDGTKKLGERLMKVADDVSDAFNAWAKEPGNLFKLSSFSVRSGEDVKTAIFKDRETAERAIKRSGLSGKAIVFPEKRGVNRVIMSPSEAIARGIWQGDGDKRITLSDEFGAELVEGIGRAAKRGKKVNDRLNAPWQFERAYERRKQLQRMGIETPAEFRAALREFIGLREQAQEEDRIKAMERAMIGKAKDGLDFFPTPDAVADEMIAAAEIQPDMAVLEPSAGMGHIADRIRAAGAEPDVVEMSNSRAELLEAKGFTVVARDFMDMNPRGFTYGDVFKHADGRMGILGANGGLGSSQYKFIPMDGDTRTFTYEDREDLTGVEKRGGNSGYDRIVMNPPFSDGRDIQHVQHAYTLLRPGGRLVAIMGESAFTNQSKRAEDFRAWLDDVGGTEEKLAEGSFMDPSLPVNTGVNARMVVIDKPTDAPAFSRNAPAAGMRLSAVQSAVDELTATWANAPDVEVLGSMDDAPEPVRAEWMRQNSQGASGDIEGFHWRGKVYLVASALGTDSDTARVLFHEALGHYGLRGVFGAELKPILMQFSKARPKEIAAKAKQYGLDLSKESDRLTAAEEVLAELAQTQPQISFVKRAIAAIRTWLRDNIPGMQSLALTDDEIVRSFILPARGFVERGRAGPDAIAAALAFSRSYEAPVWYSELARRVEKADMRAAPASAWLAWLKGLEQKGVKPDEIEWSGVREWLALQTGKVSKADVLEYLSNNGVQVQETVLQDDPSVNGEKGEGSYNYVVFSGDDVAIREQADERAADSVMFARGTTDRTPNESPAPDTGGAMFSRAADPRDASTFVARARDTFADHITTAKTFNWWNKSVGTQYQKADQDKGFKRVFDATQDYILDISRLANDSADRARDLLPKLENFRDVLKDLPGIDKDRTTKADLDAIGKAIFQGTLADTREYKPAELKSVFGLTDKQIGLYQQFRAAVNKSLDDLTATIAAKMIRNAGIPAHMFRDELEQGDHEALFKMTRDWVKQDPNMAALANQVGEVSDRVKRLKGEGYAPLMRFGQYAVSVRDEFGRLEEFHMFESQAKANIKARQLKADGKMADVSVMSTQDYKLLNGISPESLELFGDLLEKAGVFDPRDEVFQTYIREAIDNRSAMKRMLERQGYPGYSTDVRRVLATFLTSNARLASKNLHFTDMLEAVDNIPKSRGDVRDEATNLVKYVQEPVEEAHKIRALLFAQYIGGNVASAMVNMTQTLTMTLPYLSQFGGKAGPVVAAKKLLAAMKQATGKVDGDLGDALIRAEQAGVVSPQEIHHLNAEAMGTFGSNPVVQKAMFLWGSLFSLAEQFNRRVAFIAAYNMAPAGKDAYDFAVKAVEETQGIYNRGNRPNWARGAVGSTLFTFKQFSISYLEFLSRLPNREKALAMAILMLAAGAEGLPFADDLDDVIDTIAQRLGYSFNSKEQKRRFIGSVLGSGGAEFVLKGASSIPGMPIDISARMGMANLLPGTGMLRKDVKDHMRDVVEFAGPVGGIVQDATRGEFTPTAVRNLAKSVDMFQAGMYRDSKGRKVVDVDAVDAAWKAIGFQPAEVARESQKVRMVQQNINLAKTVESEIADSMAEARFERDPVKLQEARDRLADWNEKNPTDRIRIDGAQIVRRLREMRKTREERIIKSAPREMRQEVRSSLQ